jgi:hypothetical protein
LVNAAFAKAWRLAMRETAAHKVGVQDAAVQQENRIPMRARAGS